MAERCRKPPCPSIFRPNLSPIAIFSSPLASLAQKGGSFPRMPRPVVPDLLLWLPDFSAAQPTATVKHIFYRATQ